MMLFYSRLNPVRFNSKEMLTLSPELIMNQVAGGLLRIDGIPPQINLKSRYLKLYVTVTSQTQFRTLTNAPIKEITSGANESPIALREFAK